MREFSLPPQENLEGRAFRCNDGSSSGIVADAVTTCEPSLDRRARVDGRVGDSTKAIGHIMSPDQSALAASSYSPLAGWVIKQQTERDELSDY